MEINEEKLKGILKKHQKHTDIKINEIKRHFDIVREDFDSNVKLIAEQYNSIIEKLDGHDKKFELARK